MIVEQDSNVSTEVTEVSREQQVVDTIHHLEVPFMNALQRAYGKDRRWRICGPASIALSRILSSLTNVPILPNGEEEHIQLAVGIFDPHEDPNRLQRIEEQTYIRYYNGKGDVYYIDPIYGLLMGGKTDINGTIQVEKYRIDEIDEALARNQNLYPFELDSERTRLTPIFAKLSIASRKDFYESSIASLHDERATLPAYLTPTGNIIRTDTGRAEEVIREFVPGWKVDEATALKHVKAVAHAMFPRREEDPKRKFLEDYNIFREKKIRREKTLISFSDDKSLYKTKPFESVIIDK